MATDPTPLQTIAALEREGWDPTIAATAAHEAGHAVIMLGLGYHVMYATIEPDLKEQVLLMREPIANLINLSNALKPFADAQLLTKALRSVTALLEDFQRANGDQGLLLIIKARLLTSLEELGAIAKQVPLSSEVKQLFKGLIKLVKREIRRAGHVRAATPKARNSPFNQREESERQIEMLLAGMEAERQAGVDKWESGGSLDLNAINSLLSQAPPDERALHLRLLKVRCEVDVAAHFVAIQHVARLLLRERTVLGTDLRNSLEQAGLFPDPFDHSWLPRK